MRSCRLALASLALSGLGLVCGDAARAAEREPHIGYVYPAGAGLDTVTRVTIGGQFLQGASQVHVTGEGVEASVVGYVKPLTKKQEGEVRKQLNYLRRCNQAEQAGKEPPPVPKDLPEIPDHPWLTGMADMDNPALEVLRLKLFNPKQQPNSQIAETVQIEVTVSPDAPPGDREVRIAGSLGLTNPMRFQVGDLDEFQEPAGESADRSETAAHRPPFLINGRILPGEVDRFQFTGRKGQQIHITTLARRLIPYLADAVPGWFQAVLTVTDAEGREMACADDTFFHPDPTLVLELPHDGEYTIEIRDAIYRGRKDFVYRIRVDESGLSIGDPTGDGSGMANAVPEREPNNRISDATPVSLPEWVTGRIDRPGDVDLYRFRGRNGDTVVLEAFARRHLNAPTDTLVRLMDDAGKVLEWNDDHMVKEGHLHVGPGLLTHHADAYLRTRLPKDGTYYVSVEDAQRHGGEAYAYRLRMTPPRPDFSLRMTPSSLRIPATQTVPVDVYVDRKDGFDADIHLRLVDPPPGFHLDGNVIPSGKDRIRVTLTAPDTPTELPVCLQVEGSARIGDRNLRHLAVPADNTMQAFLWRHLVPAQEWMVEVGNRKWVSETILPIEAGTVQIAAGSEATIRLRAPRRPVLKNIQWELVDPPPGLTLSQAVIDEGDLVLSIQASDEEAGTRDNLIVGGILKRPGKGKQRAQQIPVGVLPAIPIEIVGTKG